MVPTVGPTDGPTDRRADGLTASWHWRGPFFMYKRGFLPLLCRAPFPNSASASDPLESDFSAWCFYLRCWLWLSGRDRVGVRCCRSLNVHKNASSYYLGGGRGGGGITAHTPTSRISPPDSPLRGPELSSWRCPPLSPPTRSPIQRFSPQLHPTP